MPIGEWERTNIANLGFNRWALDITPAVTWFDAKSGAEISAAAGFTYNWENPDTDYKTGTEFHIEFALMQHFSKPFAAGLVGYHYQQVTGDSGAGAALGSFEGRVTALGPDISYTLICGKIPVSTELKVFHEFDVENRVEGNAGSRFPCRCRWTPTDLIERYRCKRSRDIGLATLTIWRAAERAPRLRADSCFRP